MTMAAKLTQQHLEQITEYLTERFPALKSPRPRKGVYPAYEMEIRERVIRVEEELKSQRELMREMMVQIDRRFEQVDKRFEQVDKRFEDVSKRFSMLMWFTGLGFTITIAFFTGALAYFR